MMQLINNQEAIGIDLGGTNIRIARISNNGEILEHVVKRVPKGKADQLQVINESLMQLVSPKSAGIGIGVAGRVRVSDGMVLTAGYLDLDDVPLGDLIRDKTGLPVIIDNDAHMAVIAEIKIGAAIGMKSVVMFTIGTGIGGAIVLNNEIYYGRGIAGQLGHITVDMNGKICNCGRKGCVETFSSGSALREYIKAASFPREVMIEDLFDMEEAGNKQAEEIITTWITPLRSAIDSLVAILHPELVLLGGGLGQAAYRALNRVPPQSPWFQYQVKPATLGDNAGVIGAGLRAFTAS